MRILVLILQYPPDVNAAGRLMADLCRGFVDKGHQVTVLTTFPHYAEFRVWEEFRGKLSTHRMDDGVDVRRVYVHATGRKARMLDRFLSYFSFSLLAAIFGILDGRRYDVIICSNGGFLPGIAAVALSKVKNVPYVLNIQDLYPETPIRSGQIRNPLAIRALRWLERFMYNHAKAIVSITPSFNEHLKVIGIPVERMAVIPNFVDIDFIRPMPKQSAYSDRMGLTNKFVVSHAGNIGYVYDLDTMLDAARILADELDILFLIVGDGVEKSRLELKVHNMRLANVRFLPYQPQEDLPYLRAASDIQVSLYRRGSASHSMASKVYEIMASARPLLASAEANSDVWRLIDETGCGLCIEPENATALAAAVLRLYRDSELRKTMSERGREHAEQQYSRAAVVDQYLELLGQFRATR